jgi:thioredoxin-related protein
MKKVIPLLVSLFIVTNLVAQVDTIQPPYKKFPSFPPVKLLMADSVSFYTKDDLPKKKPVMLMLFNPQCEHCQHETEELVKNIDKFKDIQIVMSTSMLFDSLLTFREKYKLAQYKNIVVTQDTHFFLYSFFTVHNLPFLAFYNKRKELISVFEGSMPIERVLNELKK